MNSRGKDGEKVARRFLEESGCRVIATNFRSRWGELDIVVIDAQRTLVFVEVKSYSPHSMVDPLFAITPIKVHRIKKTIRYFLMRYPGYVDYDMRIDAVVTDGVAVQAHIEAI